MGICASCPSNPSCSACIEYIDGGSLRKKVDPPVRLSLQDPLTEKSYNGHLLVISRVGMLIETEAPNNTYKVNIDGEIDAEVSPVFYKGLEEHGVMAFDITKVSRNQDHDTRLSRDEYEYLFMNKRELVDHLTEDLQDDVKNKVRDALKEELLKSELLEQLQVGTTYKYEKGRLKQISGEKEPLLTESLMLKMMQDALRDNEPKRDTIIDEDTKRYIDIHSIPLGYQSGGFLTFDITDVVRKEKELMEEQWNSFRDVVHAVSNGKVQLVKKETIAEIVNHYKMEAVFDLQSANQLTDIRERLKDILLNAEMPVAFHYRILLTVQEGLTNALKHVGNGHMEVFENDTNLLFVIQDRGDGIRLQDIPRATLIKGYSTSATLGQGFHLMTTYTDQLYIKTDEKGTTLLLEFNKKSNGDIITSVKTTPK